MTTDKTSTYNGSTNKTSYDVVSLPHEGQEGHCKSDRNPALREGDLSCLGDWKTTCLEERGFTEGGLI